MSGERVSGLYGTMDDGQQMESGPEHVYLPSAEDHGRAAIGGVDAARMGKLVSLRPVLSKADYANLQFGCLPPVTGYEDSVHPFIRQGTKEWDSFMKDRKFVEFGGGSSGSRVALTKDMDGALKSVDKVDGVSKVYRLTQFLTDATVHEKFQLSLQVLHTLRQLAIARPDAAARQATELLGRIRPGGKYSVTAAGYSTSRRRACDVVEQYCGKFRPLTVTVECTAIGQDMFSYGPGPEETRWHVSAPFSYVKEMLLVHRAVEYCGGAPVMVALGAELTILHIDIHDGPGYLSPLVELHVGDQDSELPMDSSPVTSGLLSLDARLRLEALRTDIAEVRLEGSLVASCVRVSRKYALMSSHVADAGNVTVDGVAVRRLRELSSDLWLVEAVGPGDVSWPLRAARQGERVVVCYRAAGGGIQYTSPLSVLSCSGEALSMSVSGELVKGMSGGAVVALDDLALLGVYEGVGRQRSMALQFTPEMFAEVHETLDTASNVSRGEPDILARMRSKGLGSYMKAVFDAVQPLYFGQTHVGHAFTSGGVCMTTCDPDAVPLALRPDAQPLVFNAHSFSIYSSEKSDVREPLIRRTPSYFERVVIVGRDASGPYYSRQTRVMHIGANGANFSLEGIDADPELPFVGGLVISLADAAVLGVYVKHSASPSLGLVEFCVPYPAPGTGKESTFQEAKVELSKLFPMLSVSSWPEGVVEEVFTHSSAQKYVVSKSVFNAGMAPLAFIGDSLVKVHFGERARASKLPVARWQTHVQKSQSNAAYAALAGHTGLDRLVKFGNGATPPPPGSKVYADVVEALAGAVYLYERAEVVGVFCDALLARLGETYDGLEGRPTTPSTLDDL